MPTFINPIIRGFNPDPTICAVPATADRPRRYFLSTSTFEYFPGCAIYESTDLVNWTLIGHALTRKSQIDLRTVEPGAGSWASTLRYREKEGRWYLTNGLFLRYRPGDDERIFPRGFYVWTDNIYDSSSWSDPVYFDNPGYDQDLFWDDSTNKVYLSTTVRLGHRPRNSHLKDFAIHMSEIDLAAGRTLEPPVVLRASPGGCAEGSHLFTRGKYYYLMTAEGGTEQGHQEWIFRSSEGPYGPWESQGKPMWYNGPNEEVQRTGHADLFQDGEGNWWGVVLGVRPVRGEQWGWLEPQMGRETFLVQVEWVDDWPVFNGGKNISLLTEGRKEVVQEVEKIKAGDVKWKADLSKEDLELGWYQKCTPLKQCYTLTEKPGTLRIYGNCYELSWPESPAMLLRKQSSYTESFHAKLHFNPSRVGYEAGVVLWWHQYSYATIGVTLRELPNGDRVRTVVCRKPAGMPNVMEEIEPLANDAADANASHTVSESVELKIEARPRDYQLTLVSGGVTETFTVNAEDLTVIPPVGLTFCGVMFGVYSSGKQEPVLDPADFSDIYVQAEEGKI